MKFSLKLLLAICTAWAAAGCGSDDASDDPKLSSMRFELTSYDLAEGQTATPVLLLQPVNGAEFRHDAARNRYGVTFSTADTSIAMVSSDGLVTALKQGTTTLTAHSPYCPTTAAAQLIVSENIELLTIESLRFEQAQYGVAAGESVQPKLFVRIKGEPSEFAYDASRNPYSVTWNSSDNAVATVSVQGEVAGLAPGAAVLTARTPYFAESATAALTVRIASLRFEQAEYAVASQTVRPQLMIRLTGDGAEAAYDLTANPYNVTFSVSDPSVASVAATGVVTRLKAGETTLTAQTNLYAQPITTTIRFSNAASADWVGEWVLASWTGDPALAGKVYIALMQQNAFEIYQNINATGFAKFSGTYSVTEEEGAQVIAGTYTDGTPWGDSYTFTATDERLTLTGRATGYVSVYDRTTIPDYVRDGVTVRSTRAETTPFL